MNRQPVLRPDEMGRTGGPASLDDALLLEWIESRVRAGVKPSSLSAYALLAGAAFTGDITVPDEAYGSGWNGSTEAPTKNALWDKIETLPTSSGRQWYYGHGGDGALSISAGTTTIARNMFYSSVTISGTAALRTTNWDIFVSGDTDLSAAPAGAITCGVAADGNNAGGTVGGSAVGIGATQHMLPAASAGGNGANGGTGNGAQGSNAASSTRCMVMSNAGSSGKGGNGASGTGGAARAIGAPGSYYQLTWFSPSTAQIDGATIIVQQCGQGGAGGSSGAGDGTAGGGGGGGGGGGLAVRWITYSLTRGGSTAAGTFDVRGGHGGNGASPAGGNRGGGGGGAGGGGGWFYLLYHSLLGSTASNMIKASGGNGGNGAAGTGTGTSGDGGYGGVAGVVIIQPDDGAPTIYKGTTSVANSGATGGTGESLLVSL